MSQDSEYHELRAQIASDGAKALLIINGGGIVALLGFLSTVWTSGEHSLLLAILEGIWFLALALVSSASNYFMRFWASTSFQRNWQIRHWIFWSLEWISVIASFCLFLVGLYLVVTGAENVIR